MRKRALLLAGAAVLVVAEEFLVWARRDDPTELQALMPNGEIDPSGDHPARFRVLLNRWRAAAGLEPIWGETGVMGGGQGPPGPP